MKQQNEQAVQKFYFVLEAREILAISDFIDIAVKAKGRECNLGLADFLLRKLDKDPVKIEPEHTSENVEQEPSSGEIPQTACETDGEKNVGE